MGGFVYQQTDSGLVLASHGSDEAAVARALKDYDPDLRLVPQWSESLQAQYWSVYRYAGSERPAELICVWADERGEVLPLSMNLLEKVKQLDRNTRSGYASADERERERREREEKRQRQQVEDLTADWLTREGRSAVLPRSQSLRRARSRTGYHDHG